MRNRLKKLAIELDIYNRDGAISYINGEVYSTNTHSEAVILYYDEHNEANDDEPDFLNKRNRPSRSEYEEIGVEHLCFGHLVSNESTQYGEEGKFFTIPRGIYIEEDSLINVDINTVVEAFKKEFPDYPIFKFEQNKFSKKYEQIASINTKRLIRKAEYETSFSDIREAISSGFEVLDGVLEGNKILDIMTRFETSINEATSNIGLSLTCMWGYNDNVNMYAYYLDGGDKIYLNEAAITKIDNLSGESFRWIAFHEVGHAFDNKHGEISNSLEWKDLLAKDTSGLGDWGKESYDGESLASEAFANAFFAVFGGNAYGLESQSIIDFIKGLN